MREIILNIICNVNPANVFSRDEITRATPNRFSIQNCFLVYWLLTKSRECTSTPILSPRQGGRLGGFMPCQGYLSESKCNGLGFNLIMTGIFFTRFSTFSLYS